MIMNEEIRPNSDEKPILGLVNLPENSIQHDFGLADRYQAFSAELLRLSLLAIAGIGFLLANVFIKDKESPSYQAFLSDPNIRLYLSRSLWCLGISSGAALLHRYVSTDSLASQLRYARIHARKKSSDFNRKRRRLLVIRVSNADFERVKRQVAFSISYWSLWLSAILLGVGAILLALCLVNWLDAVAKVA
jgi:hypothetical protein